MHIHIHTAGLWATYPLRSTFGPACWPPNTTPATPKALNTTPATPKALKPTATSLFIGCRLCRRPLSQLMELFWDHGCVEFNFCLQMVAFCLSPSGDGSSLWYVD